MRLYQWNNPEVRDAIFFEYDIAHISNYNYPSMGFGYMIYPGIGDGEVGFIDYGSYDREIDLTYQWRYARNGYLPNIRRQVMPI